MYHDVLTFWFDEAGARAWWSARPAFDRQLRERFGDTLERAARGELHAWRDEPAGRLAEIIVLDQFSRNIHRGSPMAFACDPMALVLAQWAVAADAHRQLKQRERNFLLMPWMHSESRAIHAQGWPLFQQFAAKRTCQFERRHQAIIDRFGRYPHRNAILGRRSTPEELDFLKQPGSSF